MKKSGKVIYVGTAILFLLGVLLWVIKNGDVPPEAFGFECASYCVLLYLFARPFTKRSEQQVILFVFVAGLVFYGVKFAIEMAFNKIIAAWGWCVVGLLVICAISFIARKAKLIVEEEKSEKAKG